MQTFNFNQALKKKEEREQADKYKTASESALKNRNINYLYDVLDEFVRSRIFPAAIEFHLHKLLVHTSLNRFLLITAESENLFAITPENTDRVTGRLGAIPSGMDLSSDGVTRMLVDWIVPKS